MRTGLFRGLGVLQALIGIGAVAGGLLLVVDPSGATLGTPIELLDNTPFSTFLVPGMVLFLVNGLGSVVGSASSFIRHRRAGELAMALGVFLIMWIAVQVYWMAPHWLHALYFALGILEVALGWSVWNSLRTTGEAAA